MSEPHARFQAWLLAGAEGDPPRDLAVHASVCATCRASIAAFDRLAFVDPGAATIPAPTRPVTRGALVRAGRALGATFGVLIAATVLGVGGWQLIEAARGGPDGIARASGTPNQAVLAGSGTPAASASPEASASPVAASAAAVPTASPSGAPAATPRPGATATPRPVATPQPSIPGPTSTSVPTPVPTTAPATPQPTVAPTDTPGASPPPSATPTPTPTPTPAPTTPGAPSLNSPTAISSGEVDLSWTAPIADGGSAITGYRIYRDGIEIDAVGVVAFYADTGVEPLTLYSYRIAAINAVGTGPPSDAMDATTP